MKEQSELTETDEKLKNSIAMQLQFYTHSGLPMEKAIDNIFAKSKEYAAQFKDSSPIEGVKECDIIRKFQDEHYPIDENPSNAQRIEANKLPIIRRNAFYMGWTEHANYQSNRLSQKEGELTEENERLRAALQEIAPVLYSCANMVSFIDGGGTGAHSLKDVASALIKKSTVAKRGT